ncbi:MAG: LytR C-terminal domain-containing protein [Candidatus Roizmanbacteria bacterium]
MLYIFVDRNQIKLLFAKKTLLGQYESPFYQKAHQMDLVTNGQIVSTDVLASAIKEGLNTLPSGQVKECMLILPHEALTFIRADVPADIATSAVNAFILDKARTQLKGDVDTYAYDYVVTDAENIKQVFFYAIEGDVVKKYHEVFNLLGLQLQGIIPETLCYFKLFDKTLRKDKKEFILYVNYEKDKLIGYAFDSFGPLQKDKWIVNITDEASVITAIKEKGAQYEADGQKMNRLIISGENSDSIRQDTFTKDVGIWTNPLKRILPNFYHEYLKLLVVPNNQVLPILQFEATIGAFIFTIENKMFTYFKKKLGSGTKPPGGKISFQLPLKEAGIFVVSFGISFIVLYGFSRINWGGFSFSAPTITQASPTPRPTIVVASPTPTVMPTPALARKDIRIRILNGTGASGKASLIRKALQDLGYENILTGNAPSYDYKVTEIQIKNSKKEATDIIKTDLKSNVTNPKITVLDEKNVADIVIIFGEDYSF